MTVRRYLSQLVGTGTPADPYRPVIAALLPASRPWSAVDGRTDATVPVGTMMVDADVTDAQHTALIADARVKTLEIEDAAGVPLADTALVTAIPLAKRNRVKALLAEHHVPVTAINGSTTVGEVRKWLRWRFVIRQLLHRDDYDEVMTITLAEIPEAKRNRIRLRLWEAGFDVSVLRGTDTVEEALRKLFVQLNARETAPLGTAAAVEAPPKRSTTKRTANGRKRKRR